MPVRSLRTRGLWAVASKFALSSDSAGALALTDLRKAARSGSSFGRVTSAERGQAGLDEAAVRPERTAIAVSFSDLAYEYSGTLVTDLWLLDPAACADGPLERRRRVANARRRIATRIVRLQSRKSGRDSFVVW
jgi:hypothetical protein